MQTIIPGTALMIWFGIMALLGNINPAWGIFAGLVVIIGAEIHANLGGK